MTLNQVLGWDELHPGDAAKRSPHMAFACLGVCTGHWLPHAAGTLAMLSPPETALVSLEIYFQITCLKQYLESSEHSNPEPTF